MRYAVDNSGLKRRMAPFIGYIGPHRLQKLVGILAPADRNGSSSQCIFKDKRPANDPGNQFAHGSVCVSIGTSGNRYDRSEFCITESCKCTTYGGDYKGKG